MYRSCMTALEQAIHRVQTGARIAKVRDDRGIRNIDLARAVGISHSHLSNIERGRDKVSSDLLARIAEQLGVTPDQLAS